MKDKSPSYKRVMIVILTEHEAFNDAVEDATVISKCLEEHDELRIYQTQDGDIVFAISTYDYRMETLYTNLYNEGIEY